ncbi:hypothetical protein [Erythrobacter sp.]|uniref:hypothetical protein n=1 Tax=Erythrobacter sp. TaxID=1042 RepID=UPI00345B5822
MLNLPSAKARRPSSIRAAISGIAAISSGSCATIRIAATSGQAATAATTRSIIGTPLTGTTAFCATPAASARGSSAPERLPAMTSAVTGAVILV